MPADRLLAASSYKLQACVAVETSRRPIDDQWLLNLAASEPLITGVVLNLQADQKEFASRFDAAMNSRSFVGIRLRPIDQYDLASVVLRKNIALLERAQKCIEFGAATRANKAKFAALAKEFSATTWILDHCGHPKFDGLASKDWIADMQRIAEVPNVMVKVTGCEGEAKCWRPVLNSLLDMFGAKRLLYGSNWPVSPANNVLALAEFLDTDAAAFFRDNTCSAYRMRPL